MHFMQKRPRIDLAKTKSEYIADLLGYVTFLIALLFMLDHWQQLPDQVALHFNAKGEADRWGGKKQILWLPLLTVVVGYGLHVLEKHPECYNFPRRFNEKNAADFYLLGRKVVNRVKNLMLILFAMLLVDLVCLAMQMQHPLHPWLWPTLLLSLVAVVGRGLYLQAKIQ